MVKGLRRAARLGSMHSIHVDSGEPPRTVVALYAGNIASATIRSVHEPQPARSTTAQPINVSLRHPHILTSTSCVLLGLQIHISQSL